MEVEILDVDLCSPQLRYLGQHIGLRRVPGRANTTIPSVQRELLPQLLGHRHIASFRIALHIPWTCQPTFQSRNRHQKCKLICASSRHTSYDNVI